MHEVYDLLFRLNLSIVGEEIVDVRHCLLGVADAPLEALRADALASAGAGAVQRVPGRAAATCESVAAANTALAARARRASWAIPTQAAIASDEAGDHFGLHVLKRDIANQAVNYTRFVVVAATPVDCDPRIAAKVSLVLGTRHEHGALVRCLNVLADEGLNLTKLESRPRPGTPWEYVFYIDVEGHVAEPRMQAALAGLAGAHASSCKVLGCYPSRELPGKRSDRARSPAVAAIARYNRPDMERTFAIIKPDAVKNGVAGQILARIEGGRLSRRAACA